ARFVQQYRQLHASGDVLRVAKHAQPLSLESVLVDSIRPDGRRRIRAPRSSEGETGLRLQRCDGEGRNLAGRQIGRRLRETVLSTARSDGAACGRAHIIGRGSVPIETGKSE